jgi:hypothetical protein
MIAHSIIYLDYNSTIPLMAHCERSGGYYELLFPFLSILKRIRNNCHVISVPFSKLNSMPPRSTAPVFRSESRNVYQEAHTFLGGDLILLISSKGHSVNLNIGHKFIILDQIRCLSFASCAAHFFIYTFQPLLPRHFVGHLPPPGSGLSNPTTFPYSFNNH